ncbi:MAG: type II secretion system F family protein [Candidatus Dependentiae bacterium]|nr:type II secretion system F family protein [Candidatus Dependentiae bacterium]
MALYFYRALSKEGKKISGHLDASSVESVRSQLTAKGLYPFEIKINKDSNSTSSFFTSLFERPVPFKDIIFFTKQLAVLLKSGVPLLQSLELLSEQFSGKLRSIIISLKDGVKEGNSLAQGLQAYPKTFSNIFIQLVKAGEASGKLETILERLTSYLEREEETRKKISKALSGPMVQLGAIGLMVIGIMTFVVPNLQKMLTSMGKELPIQTKILLAGSYLLTNHYLPLIFTVLAIAITFQYWLSRPQGKRTMDKIKLKIPVIKFFARTNAVVQFCSTLGMLLESGVNISNALDIVCNIIDNRILVDTLTEAKDKIIKQGKITPFLKETGLFPPMAIYLINTGEQSGNLDYMLLTVAKNYDDELIEFTDGLTSKLDPVMTIVMGLIVGFIMFAIMGPMISMYDM